MEPSWKVVKWVQEPFLLNQLVTPASVFFLSVAASLRNSEYDLFKKPRADNSQKLQSLWGEIIYINAPWRKSWVDNKAI